METFKMPRATIGKTLIGMIIAIIIGMIFPVVLTFQLTLMMPLIFISNLLMPVLFVAGGMPAVIALVISELASTIFFFGDTIGLMILAASVFPGVAVLMGIKKRAHFFEQLRAGIVTHAIGFVAAIFIAYLNFGGNMIQKFIDGVREQFNVIPDEILLPAVESINQMIASMAGGMVAPENIVTVESYRNVVSGTMMDLMQEMYVEYIPGCILIGAVLTGLLSVLWGNWRMARKGLATSESFIGMSGWNLPPFVSLGVFFLWISGYLYTLNDSIKSADTIYRTIYMLVQVAFYIQAFSCLDRSLIRRYMGLRGRRIVIFLVLIGAMIIPVFNLIMFVWGCGSTFMTVIRPIKANMDENKDDDNDSENNHENKQ